METYDAEKAITLLARCKPLASKLPQPGEVYTYSPQGEELEILRDFARLYDTVSGKQLKLYAGEALLTQIELLYLLDLMALVRLRGEEL
ncbi:MAG TPA: hypothetical protein VH186_24260 [Chloroflexia bacterium]|nr:hypothetical protein [Chloroflexia bacterium]